MSVQKARTDEIVRVASAAFNAKTSERHYINEVHFSFHNHREIMEALESGRAIDLPIVPKRPGKSVLVISSGGTLDEALPLLKDWEGDVICSTSHASTLKAWGREPEHIVALDPDSNPWEMAADTWEGTKSWLHMHPGVTPDLVRWWPGRISLFRKLQPQSPFYANEQAMGYSKLGPLRDNRYLGNEAALEITGQVPMLASVLPAQICIAKHLGYRQQVLVGADFAYTDGRTRFTARKWEDGQWVTHHPVSIANLIEAGNIGPDPLIETEVDGLMSTPMKIFYAHQTVIAWRIVEVDIINASHKGFLRMFPHVPIEEVIRRGNKGVKGFNLKQIRAASEEHLARQNIYFFIVGDGIIPREFKDPLHEIPKAAKELKALLVQQGRGEQFDEEANMKRIRKLFAMVIDAA